MSKRRGGFTLIELLMVIVVISILTSLVTMASMSVISQARGAATKATLRIAQKIIDDRNVSVSAVINKAREIDPFLQLGAVFSSEIQSIQNDRSLTPAQIPPMVRRVEDVRDAVGLRLIPFQSADDRTKKVIAMIEWQRLLLPQTWAEADFHRCFRRLPPVSSINPATENSEVLLFMLTQGKSEGLLSVDADAEAITPSMKKDTDGNGEMELVDSWGNHIRFIRWPTRLLRPNGFPANYKPRDTFDNSNMPPTLIEAKYIPAMDQSGVSNAQILFGLQPTDTVDPYDPLNLQINYRVPDSSINSLNTSAEVAAMESDYYLPHTHHQPVVVSAGPDGKFGMHNPLDKASFGYWGKIETVGDFYDNLADK